MGIEYLVFIFLGFVASVTSTIFGLGSALVVLAVGPYILPVKEVIALSAVLFIASTLTKSIVFARYIDLKIAEIMAISSLPFAYLGASLVPDLPAENLKQMLGLMILLYVGLSVFNLFPSLEIGTAGVIAGSAGYGFVSGLLGSGNLVKAVIFREMSMSKEAFVGAMAATSVLANLAKLAAYNHTNLLNDSQLKPMFGLSVAAVLAVFVGRKFLRRLTVMGFGFGVQVVLAVSAFGLLI
ncbi:MAG: sulfite exporter TauE/SafE family protein [Arenicellales bacterium]